MTYEQIIQKAGKRIIPRVYYYENGTEVSLERDDFQQAKFNFNASLVGTVMSGVELEVKKTLPDTSIFIEITARFNEYTAKKVYGGYLRRSEPTYNADAKTYTYEMYDKIITTMVDYKPIDITYPTTIYNFFKKLVSELNFTTDITSLPNGSKVIKKDIYDGINYTYRDVLNDIGQATGTLFVIEESKIKKCSLGTTTATVDDDILKNQNITLGKHFGPINTIVLTRSGDSDSIYYPKTLPANPIEFRIANNQLMNENDREDYLEAIYNQLQGIEFDVYDTALVGYGGFTPLEKIKINTGGKEYNSYVFNNEITISQGYEEVIYTEMPTETSTDYKASDNTDRRINQVYIIARKLEKEIVAVVDTTNKIQKEINPTKNESGSEIIIEDGSNNPLTYLEIEGKSVQDGEPTPDMPVEIDSVGYENLFDYTLLDSDKEVEWTYYYNKGLKAYAIPIYIGIGNKATASTNIPTLSSGNGFYFMNNLNNSSSYALHISQSPQTIEANADGYVYMAYIKGRTYYTDVKNGTYWIQVVKGITAHSYISFGKYGIEVETVGKNLFDKDNFSYELNYYNDDGEEQTSLSTGKTLMKIPVESNSDYVIDGFSIMTYQNQGTVSRIYFFDENKQFISRSNLISGSTKYIFTTPTNCKYIDFQITVKTDSDTVNKKFLDDVDTFELKKGLAETEYEPYQKKTLLITLNKPLRSLPNGVKDIAYIRNNKLYVDRYVGSVILNGSENWDGAPQDNYYDFWLFNKNISNMKIMEHYKMCNYFKYEYKGFRDASIPSLCENTLGVANKLVLFKTDGSQGTTVDEWVLWLSTHNIEVTYELATPVTEELGEIKMLNTLKGYNNIAVNDKLLPIINLTYVRDTIIADYVENHVAELKLTENEIKTSVEKVSTSVDGLNSTVNRVEEITTDNSQIINVISTNIDKTTGEVREVTTTTGFTFNADGMTINDGSGFKAEHKANGTYYKDGNSIVGEYTKDGSKQKDLSLFGIYSYGMKDKDDTPMFIGQLFTNENGEEGFGHFYNGGDY